MRVLKRVLIVFGGLLLLTVVACGLRRQHRQDHEVSRRPGHGGPVLGHPGPMIVYGTLVALVAIVVLVGGTLGFVSLLVGWRITRTSRMTNLRSRHGR